MIPFTWLTIVIYTSKLVSRHVLLFFCPSLALHKFILFPHFTALIYSVPYTVHANCLDKLYSRFITDEPAYIIVCKCSVRALCPYFHTLTRVWDWITLLWVNKLTLDFVERSSVWSFIHFFRASFFFYFNWRLTFEMGVCYNFATFSFYLIDIFHKSQLIFDWIW